jgi:hypothetical protein
MPNLKETMIEIVGLLKGGDRAVTIDVADQGYETVRQITIRWNARYSLKSLM